MNSLVQYHRANAPNDPRTDDEITLLIGDNYPGVYDTYQDFKSQYDSLSHARKMLYAPSLPVEARKSFEHGADTAQAKLYDTAALLGDMTGLEGVRKFGEEGYRRNMEEAATNAPTIPSIRDVTGPSDFARYLTGLVASQTPQIGGTLAASAVGGLAGTVAGGIPGGLAGAAIGGSAAGFTQMQNYGELKGTPGVDQSSVIPTAIGVGGLGAILEMIVPLKVTAAFVRTAGKDVAAKYILRALKDVPVNALTEASTEVAQEVVAIAGEMYANRDNPKFHLTNGQIIGRLVDSGLAGAFLGAPAGAIEAIPYKPKPPQTNYDAVIEDRIKGLTPERRVEVEALKARLVAGGAPSLADSQLEQALTPEERVLFAVAGTSQRTSTAATTTTTTANTTTVPPAVTTVPPAVTTVPPAVTTVPPAVDVVPPAVTPPEPKSPAEVEAERLANLDARTKMFLASQGVNQGDDELRRIAEETLVNRKREAERVANLEARTKAFMEHQGGQANEADRLKRMIDATETDRLTDAQLHDAYFNGSLRRKVKDLNLKEVDRILDEDRRRRSEGKAPPAAAAAVEPTVVPPEQKPPSESESERLAKRTQDFRDFQGRQANEDDALKRMAEATIAGRKAKAAVAPAPAFTHLVSSVQRVPLKDFDFTHVGANEDGTAILGPGMYFATAEEKNHPSKDFSSFYYGNRGLEAQRAYIRDAEISEVGQVLVDKEKWDAAAREAGFADAEAINDVGKISTLNDGRYPIGGFVKVLGKKAALELVVKHGILGLKEKLPSGVYEYSIYSKDAIKVVDAPAPVAVTPPAPKPPVIKPAVVAPPPVIESKSSGKGSDWVKALKKAFNLTMAQAKASFGIVKAMGLDESQIHIAKGGESGPNALDQHVTPEHDKTYMDAVNRGDLTAAQRIVDTAAAKAAKNAGNVVGPVWHGGTFSVGQGDSTFNAWTHFGTEAASQERVGGSGVTDNLIRSVDVQQDSDGHWYFSVEGSDDDTPYKSKAEAREAGEREAVKMAEYADPPDGSFTKVYLYGNYVKIPDLGKWGIWDVIRNLPSKYKLSPSEVEEIGKATQQGREGDDWHKLTSLLQSKGVDGFQYKNTVEDKGSTSYIALSPNRIKSSDAITRDGAGKVIPISERFNPKSPSILYQDIRESKSAPVGLWEYVAQAISSAKTSRSQIPSTFKAVPWKSGTVNADIGGGKYDKLTEALKVLGVENLIYDPFNRTQEHNGDVASRIQNGGADTATVNNVLNTINEAGIRDRVIRQAANAVGKEGKAYFKIYEGNSSGSGKVTSDGWQENRKASTYLDEIRKRFSNVSLVSLKGNIIEASGALEIERQSRRSSLITPEQDAAYLAAVKIGDTDAAQRMVDEAVKTAGYIIGLFHGTPTSGITVFNVGEQGIHVGTEEQARMAAYWKLISDRGVGQLGRTFLQMPADVQDAIRALEKKGPMQVAAKISNPLVVDKDIFLGGKSQFITNLRALFLPQINKLSKQERSDAADKAYLALKERYGGEFPRRLESAYYRIREGEITEYPSADEAEMLPLAFDKIGGVLAARNVSEMFQALQSLGYHSIQYPNQKEGEGKSYALFSPNQIKSSDAITRDDAGKVIPLSERFNPKSSSILYQDGMSRLDAAYLKAVNAGDMVAAQQMVDEAAKAAGYNSPRLYHGSETDTPITIVDPNAKNQPNKKRESGPKAFWTTPQDSYASNYGVKLYAVYAKIGKILNGGEYMTKEEGSVSVEGENPRLTREQFTDYVNRFGRYPSSRGAFPQTNGSYIYGALSKKSSEAVFDNWGRRGGPTLMDLFSYTDVGVISLSHIGNAKDRALLRDIIVENGFNTYYNNGNGRGEFALLHGKEQVKSADPVTYDAKGKVIPLSERFDSNSPSIWFQGKKGSVEFAADGTSLMRAFASSDVSTSLHEIFHIARRYLFDRSLAPEQRVGITDADIATAEEWAGAKDGVWDRAAEEKFARGLERYFRDGFAPTESLRDVFAKISEWLMAIYHTVEGSEVDVEISPEMRKVFDRLATRGERMSAKADVSTSESSELSEATAERVAALTSTTQRNGWEIVMDNGDYVLRHPDTKVETLRVKTKAAMQAGATKLGRPVLGQITFEPLVDTGAARDSLIESIDFDTKPFNLGETDSRSSRSGNSVIRDVTPSYLPLSGSAVGSKVSEALIATEEFGHLITSAFASLHAAKTSQTHRMTFFENQDTGQVVGLPTYATTVRGFQVRVGPLPGAENGTTLIKFTKGGIWVPIATIRTINPMVATEQGHQIVFNDYKQFEAMLVKPAESWIRAAKRTTEASGSAMQDGGFNADGERIESQGEPSVETHDESELENKLNDLVIEELKMDKKGKSRRSVTINTIDDVLKNIFKQDENQDVKVWALSSVLKIVLNDEAHLEKFQAMGNLEQQKRLLAGLGKIVYEAYKQAAFGDTIGDTFKGLFVEADSDKSKRPEDGVRGDKPGQPNKVGAAGNPVVDPSSGQVKQRRGDGRRGDQSPSGKAWSAVIDRLRMAGVDVQVFTRSLDKSLHQFFQSSGSGIYDPDLNVVALVLEDASNPTREDVIAALHEAAHFLFPQESVEMRARLMKAMSQLSDTELGLTGSTDVRNRADNPDGLSHAEHMEERLAERIALQGVNRTVATGMAARIMRFIKGLYHRVMMAVQESMFGSSNPHLADAYFQNRVDSFLAGDRAFSVIEFLGGGRLSPDRRAAFHTAAPGNEMVYSRWNIEESRMEYPDLLPDSADAIRMNINNPRSRQRKAGSVTSSNEGSPDTKPDIKNEDVAANNAVKDTITALYETWELTGNNATTTGKTLLNYEAFENWVLGVKGVLPINTLSPANIIAAANDELKRLGQPPVNPNLRFEGMNEEAQKSAVSKALAMIRRIQSKMAGRLSDEEFQHSDEPGSEQSKFDRNAKRLVGLVADGAADQMVMNQARIALNNLLRELSDDVVQVKNDARRVGAMSQALRDLKVDMKHGQVGTQYASVITKLYRKLNEDDEWSGSFFDLLQDLANQDVDWSKSKLPEVRAILQTVASKYPKLLEPIIGDTEESKAMLVLVSEFLRSDSLVMNRLEIRGSKIEGDKEGLIDALKAALSGTAEHIKNARSVAKKIPKLTRAATRILDELESVIDEQKQIRAELDLGQSFIEMHRATRVAMREQMAKLERVLGVRNVSFETLDGSVYVVPPKKDSTADEVEASVSKFKQTRDGAQDLKLKKDILLMQQWMDAHPEGDKLHKGATWNRLSDQVDKLRDAGINHKAEVRKRSFTIAFIGSMTDKLKLVGHPAAASMVRRLNRYITAINSHRSDAELIGHKWSVAESKAMAAVGFRGGELDLFRDRFFDKAFKYIESRKDILQASATHEIAVTEVLKQLKIYLMADPDTANALGKVGAWDALERYYRLTAEASTYFVTIASKEGLKIKDDAGGVFRDTKGAPLFETMRRVSQSLGLVYADMVGTWLDDSVSLKKASIAEAYTTNSAKLSAALAPRFSESVWNNFVKPLAYMPGRSVFYAPADENGRHLIASIANVKRAFNEAGGDAVKFAESLYELSDGKTDIGEFVGETMSTFQSYFESVHTLHKENEASRKFSLEPIGHILMDARRSESFPSEWLQFRPYDIHSSRSLVDMIANHTAFGRDLVGASNDFDVAIESLKKLKVIYDEQVVKVVQTENFGKRITKAMLVKRAEAIGGAGYYTKLTNATRDLGMVTAEKDRFLQFVKSQSGVMLELRAFSELVSTVVSLVVQSPSTAITDTSSMFKPILDFGLSTQTLGQIKRSVKTFASQNLGGFLGIFGKTLKWGAEYNQRRIDMGVKDTDTVLTFKDKVRAIIHSQPPIDGDSISGQVGRGVKIGSRVIRAALTTGIKSRSGSSQFPTVKAALFTQVGLTMNAAVIDGVWNASEDMVMRAAGYYEKNPASMSDPSFSFTAEHLGYTKKFWGLLDDASSFNYWMDTFKNYGLTLEALGADLAQRRIATTHTGLGVGPIMSDNAYERLASIGPAQITQDTSVASRSSALLTNPILHTAVPLLGWSIQQFVSVIKAFRDPTGVQDWASIRKGMLGMTAIIGVGLAYALLRDEYDEDVLGKKANVLAFGEENVMLTVLDRLSRVGTLGIGGDFANSILNQATNREFSVDSRVFAVSSIKSLMSVASTLIKQGDATYATVWRPLGQALGGSGFLQYAQILNHALDLDNAESRVTSRINAANYLRAAGRELHLDVRTGSGLKAVANAVKPWVSEMSMAAFANDAAGFQEAYNKAIKSATDEGFPDPADHVKRSFQSQHPLRSVYKTPPSEMDYVRILGTLSTAGRRDVSEAVRLFNHFGEGIGITAYDGKAEKAVKSSTLSGFRTQALHSMTSGGKYDLN